VSLPFYKSKRDLRETFPEHEIVRVYVPRRYGFLQAHGGGKFWTLKTIAERFSLPMLGNRIDEASQAR